VTAIEGESLDERILRLCATEGRKPN